MKSENKTNELDLFLGIDTHKKSWKVAFYTKDSAFKTLSMEPDAQKLRNYLDKHFQGWNYFSVYEAGFCGFAVHRELINAGIQNIVINPADVPTTDKEEKRKSDSIDCRKLARCLRNNELECIYIPSQQLESDRQLVRYRNRQLLKDHTMNVNRLKSFLKLRGISSPNDIAERWNKKYEDWVASLEFPNESDKAIRDSLLAEIKRIQTAIKDIESKIRKLAQSSAYKQQVDLLTTIPGVGLLSAMTILTEIGDISRFKNLDQLCAFVGLTPNTSGSGEKEYVGKRSKRGNKHLFWILNQCAWRIKSEDPALLKTYQQLCQRMDGSEAIIRIMKSLISRIRHVLIKQESYQCGIEK